MAEEDRWCSWKTAGPSRGDGWSGPKTTPGWSVQGILAASRGSANWFSSGSLRKSQGMCQYISISEYEVIDSFIVWIPKSGIIFENEKLIALYHSDFYFFLKVHKNHFIISAIRMESNYHWECIMLTLAKSTTGMCKYPQRTHC